MLNLRLAVWMFSVALMALDAGVVSGQNYPNKPIRIITTGVGGGGDVTSRLIGPGISGPLGQPVIIENRTPSVFAIELASKAPPDGYTLLVTGGRVWVGPLLEKAPYDAERDFSPISLISREVFILAVHPSLPVKSIKDLIALAKARPGELNYSTGAAGGAGHLATELFNSMAGVKLVFVPYKSQANEITELMNGQVQLTIADAGLITPHVKSGKLRALAVTSAQPSALVPGLPTVAASGLSGYEAGGMSGIWAPAKTPGAIINRLNQEVVRFLNLPDAKERFLNAGSEVVGSSPEQFAAIIKSDIARMSKVIKDAGIKVN